MTVPATLIRLSTGEVLQRGTLPVADPTQPVPGLDPDLKWLIDYIPYGTPLYDSRVYQLQTTEEVTTTPHPDYPIYDQYLITYDTVRRTVDEITSAVINKEREELTHHVDYLEKLAMLGLTILFREIDGLTLTPVEESIKDRIIRNGIKIFQNHQRRKQLEQEASQLDPMDIDAGWATPDADDPV
jgi:hypothetical protein